MTDDQDWRLRATLDDAKAAGAAFDRLRAHEEVLGSEVGGALPFGVVLSRDGGTLFVYASTRSGVDSARQAIERVLRSTGRNADLRVSHCDEPASPGDWTATWSKAPPATLRHVEVSTAPSSRRGTC